MYSSLLTRGDPIVYFEIDYSVKSASDDKPSEYTFSFNKVRVINTVSGKTVQTSALEKTQPRTMKPEWNLREIAGIVDLVKSNFTDVERYIEVRKVFGISKMIAIPGKNILMMSTEVTQKMYRAVMGENPSKFKGDNNPVEMVSWYDAIYFCNKLSETFGYEPVYAVGGKTDVSKWRYTPHNGNSINGDITWNLSASGFRLPTGDEWEYAAKGGANHKYAGSDNLDDVGWYSKNSGETTHLVARKKANGYGLYDMSGNVWEWLWDSRDYVSRYNCGGSWYGSADYCKVGGRYSDTAYYLQDNLGFRLVCLSGK
ncbi:MAG: SUMF1/EgtB/PvdO family nonheme iron enzyme [Treponema sp.]|nr:SUMF1/EgtB/PvdO family nonheme iron enzyme [Treponema sp.]